MRGGLLTREEAEAVERQGATRTDSGRGRGRGRRRGQLERERRRQAHRADRLLALDDPVVAVVELERVALEELAEQASCEPPHTHTQPVSPCTSERLRNNVDCRSGEEQRNECEGEGEGEQEGALR